jgi:hypothetical protein
MGTEDLSFGNTLEALMKKRNVSARELAKAIDEPQKTVNDWLVYKTRIPRDPQALKKLSEFFQVSIHFLLFGQEDPKSLLEALLEKTEIHTGLYEISIKKVSKR